MGTTELGVTWYCLDLCDNPLFTDPCPPSSDPYTAHNERLRLHRIPQGEEPNCRPARFITCPFCGFDETEWFDEGMVICWICGEWYSYLPPDPCQLELPFAPALEIAA